MKLGPRIIRGFFTFLEFASRAPGPYTETPPQTDGCLMTLYSSGKYSQHAMNGLHAASAFIIQFRTDPGAIRLAGRIEHVVSGKTATFESLHDVPELLLQMLRDAQQADAGGR